MTKHDDMTADCNSGDGGSFYASMYPGRELLIEVSNPAGVMYEIELSYSDTAASSAPETCGTATSAALARHRSRASGHGTDLPAPPHRPGALATGGGQVPGIP